MMKNRLHSIFFIIIIFNLLYGFSDETNNLKIVSKWNYGICGYSFVDDTIVWYSSGGYLISSIGDTIALDSFVYGEDLYKDSTGFYITGGKDGIIHIDDLGNEKWLSTYNYGTFTNMDVTDSFIYLADKKNGVLKYYKNDGNLFAEYYTGGKVSDIKVKNNSVIYVDSIKGIGILKDTLNTFELVDSIDAFGGFYSLDVKDTLFLSVGNNGILMGKITEDSLYGEKIISTRDRLNDILFVNDTLFLFSCYYGYNRYLYSAQIFNDSVVILDSLIESGCDNSFINKGDSLYTFSYGYGVVTFNIDNQGNIIEKEKYNVFGNILNLCILDNNIFTAEGMSGIGWYKEKDTLITNVSHKLTYRENEANGIVVKNDTIFVAEGSYGISVYYADTILDSLIFINNYDLSYAYDIDIKDNCLYVADRNGVVILDITDVTNISELSVYNNGYPRVYDVANVNDTLVGLATLDSGLVILNFKDIYNPSEVYKYSKYARKISSHDNQIFVSTGSYGLYIVSIDTLGNINLYDDILTGAYSYYATGDKWGHIFLHGNSGTLFETYMNDTLSQEGYLSLYKGSSSGIWSNNYLFIGGNTGCIRKITTDIYKPSIKVSYPPVDTAIKEQFFIIRVAVEPIYSGIDSFNLWGDIELDSSKMVNDTIYGYFNDILPEGRYNMNLIVMDSAYNERSVSWSFAVDTTSPYIDSIVPYSGSFQKDSIIELKIFYRDDNLYKVMSVNESSDTTIGYIENDEQVAIINQQIEEGSHNYQIHLVDKCGLYCDTIISLVGDFQNPLIQSLNPSSGEIMTDTNCVISFLYENAKDSGIDTVIVKIDTLEPDSIIIENDVVKSYFTHLSTGWNNRYIYIKDNSGRYEEIEDSFGVDIFPPDSINFINDRNEYYSKNIKIFWSKGYDDFSGIYNYLLKDNYNNVLYNGLDTFAVIRNLDDSLKIYLYAYDNAGNVSLEDSAFLRYVQKLFVYPSPIDLRKDRILHIEGVNIDDRVIIFDNKYNIVKDIIVNTESVLFVDMTNMKRGIYYLYVKHADGKVEKQKIGIIE